MLDRRIELLRMIAHLGTVTAAAHALYRSPSGVSRQIQDLSKELGVELLVPEGRRVRLTGPGQALVGYADRAHQMWEQIQEQLTESDEPAGEVTVVAHPSAVTTLLAPALPRLKKKYPELVMRIIEEQPPGSFNRLTTGEADICLAAVEEGVPHRDDPRFQQVEVTREPIDALVPRDHPLAPQESISLRDLATEKWVVPAEGQAGHHEVMTACRSAGFTPTVVHYAKEWSSVGALVAMSGAVSLTSRFAPDATTEVVRVQLRGNPAPARQLTATTRAGAQESKVILPVLDEIQSMIQGT